MLPSVSLPPAEAKLMRRHSMRHWIANAVRILRFPLSDAFMGGRWKEMAVMPLRYSQETKFVAVVDVIKRVLGKCEDVAPAPEPQDARLPVRAAAKRPIQKGVRVRIESLEFQF